MEQVLSAPAVQFKGSGWYVTDYAKKSSAGKGSGDSGGADSAVKTDAGDTKTESKGESKSASKKEDTGKKSPAKK